MSETIKAVGLLSGGLDSALAIRVIQDQGIEVIGLSCKHPFHNRPAKDGPGHSELVAKELGIELVRPDVSEPMLALVANPPHGYGKHMNPCIDCRILYLTLGRELMEERGARFLITGEVLGQRPMSQRRDSMDIIDRDSGLRGLIIRPLCAKLLKPTIPEDEGWVDREKLLDMSGRSRKPQLELAKKFGLSAFSSPAGGCLLTTAEFAHRMHELLTRIEAPDANDVELVKAGRNFRLSGRAFLVAGRNHRDNLRIAELAKAGDLVITTMGVPGPLGVVRGPVSEAEIESACGILASYVSRAQGEVCFSIAKADGRKLEPVSALPLDRFRVEDRRI